jgi:hypothetical protein
MWVETLDSHHGPEVIIKIKALMKKINDRAFVGQTEGRIRRKDVCKRLVRYGRQVDDREASVNRLRNAYALPLGFLDEGFDSLKR